MLIDLQRERNDGTREGEYRQGHEYVVQQGYDGTQRITPVAESDEDIQEDHQHGEKGCLHGAALQIIRDGRQDFFRCLLSDLGRTGFKLLQTHASRQVFLQSIIQLAFNQRIGSGLVVFDQIGGRDIEGRIVADRFDDRVLSVE